MKNAFKQRKKLTFNYENAAYQKFISNPSIICRLLNPSKPIKEACRVNKRDIQSINHIVKLSGKIHTYAEVKQPTNQIKQKNQVNSLLPQVKLQSENMYPNNKTQMSENIQEKTRKSPSPK
jgi:hypothetical protein